MSLAVTTADEIPTTMQGLFDLVFTKLCEQKRFGIIGPGSDWRQCTYRSGDTCCAIGFLIPDQLWDWMTTDDPITSDRSITGIIDEIANGPSTSHLSNADRDYIEAEGTVLEWPDLVLDWYDKAVRHVELLQHIQRMHDDLAMKLSSARPGALGNHLKVARRQFGIDTTTVEKLDWAWMLEHP